MKYQLIIYFLIISLACKVNSYNDTNGLIEFLSANKTKNALSMFEGNRNHNNYFIILKNHGIENNAKFNFHISWNSDNERCHNEDNWSKIKIYKMKTDLPEVLNEYHFDEYKEGEPIEYAITTVYPKGQETTNAQYVKFTIYCLDENESYFIQVPIATYQKYIFYEFYYTPTEDFDDKCIPILNESKGTNILVPFSFISLIILLIL